MPVPTGGPILSIRSSGRTSRAKTGGGASQTISPSTSPARLPRRRTREVHMNDQDILQRINALIDEEHALERSHAGEALTGDDRDRLESLEVALDQCWDLLRQRRAR